MSRALNALRERLNQSVTWQALLHGPARAGDTCSRGPSPEAGGRCAAPRPGGVLGSKPRDPTQAGIGEAGWNLQEREGQEPSPRAVLLDGGPRGWGRGLTPGPGRWPQSTCDGTLPLSSGCSSWRRNSDVQRWRPAEGLSFMRLKPNPAACPSRHRAQLADSAGLWDTSLTEGAGPEAPPWLPCRPHSWEPQTCLQSLKERPFPSLRSLLPA